jgi:RimJ/RimL family protein N-acetyltransferase
MIQTKRLKIKNFKLNLVNNNYLQWFKDKEVNKNIQFSCNNILSLKNDVKNRMKKKNSIFLSINTKKNQHIGNIYFHDINLKKKKAFMGIMIGNKKWRGKGVASEVIDSVIKKILIKRKIYFIFLGVKNSNKKAIKLYKKNNFKNYIIKKNTRLMKLDVKNNFLI